MEGKEREYLRMILKKYRQGTASADEIAFLENFDQLFDEKESFFDLHGEDVQEKVKRELKLKIDAEIDRNQIVVSTQRYRWIKYFAAASVLIMVGLGTYLFTNKPIAYQKVTKTNDFVSGTNKAILTLADGTAILLDTASNGAIAKLDGITVTKNKAGEIEYKVTSTDAVAVTYHTISTPKGGKYQVLLPDGSKIWLNAASSLTYPTAFKGKNRQVTLSGEGYFEVAKNKEMPFVVSSRNQQVEVLGTHFNINAYDDEDGVKTTLLEGAVKVLSAKDATVIKPGQQAYLKPADLSIETRTADLDQEIAWKNSLFSFKGDDLKTVMRQISRWYDVEIVYEGIINDDKFFGQISRTSKLSEVFAILELNHVHFKSRGRQIVVSSN